ncbi:MAG TPA: DUF488 domain-containing protein [Myxococcota bacterium]|nr:DUF488 domain-containing protein [Myxococcota bacterium]
MMTGSRKSVGHQIFAIGYSTRSIEDFIESLKIHDIDIVIDVRSIPKSRHRPQFNEEELRDTLHSVAIRYRHIKELGGLRHAARSSINTGWINASFRGFADYMATDGFQTGLLKLMRIAEKSRAVLMCAEGNPWRCHRSLIADALTSKNWQVFHIQSKISVKLHELTPFLRVRRGKITYP